ncbi:MAG TPA: zinc ribbon domain-containing protein [Kiritimatiellia bacterium]|nr:zinc ribbon domain-containing protein [Kiritimatiellia bacterium]
MPLFEFHCNACGKDSEVLVRTSDWKGTPCPACGSTRLVKKLSVFAASTASSSGAAAPAMPCGMPPGAGGCCGGACGMN